MMTFKRQTYISFMRAFKLSLSGHSNCHSAGIQTVIHADIQTVIRGAFKLSFKAFKLSFRHSNCHSGIQTVIQGIQTVIQN
jgi:uncharacterized protein YbjT (DUF2867 family)